MQFGRAGKGRYAAMALLASFALVMNLPDLAPFKISRLALFDQYQSLSPRQARSQPVVIVEIDEATLAVVGQWPWPRNYLASLIDSIADLKPSAIGLDILMPEADHSSPQAIAESRPDLPEDVRKALAKAASNDTLLAASLAKAPTVLGAAAFSFRTSTTLAGLRTSPVLSSQGNPQQWLRSYPYVLASLPEFQMAARGQALLTADPERGVVRRVAALSAINSAVIPGLSLEMMRIAHGAQNIVVDTGPHGIEAARVGSMRIPLQSNGESWVHFDEPSRQRYISALSIFKNEVAPERVAGKMVLIGLTGLGLQDMISTPLGDRRPGVEVHAQLIESFEDGDFLLRPWWLQWVELFLLVGVGLLFIWFIPNAELRAIARRGSDVRRAQSPAVWTPGVSDERRRARRDGGIKAGAFPLILLWLVMLVFVSGLALFHWGGLLLDGVNLSTALAAVLRSLFFSAAIEYEHQRKGAVRGLQIQRIKAAQLDGELEAARRIQMGTLPAADTAFPNERRFKIAAMLEPARQVGGDLYDFFMVDERRLFFVIGDVSGKGLPASLFMVVTKALAKSAALRGNISVGAIISMANTEMARENPEKLFVTLVAGMMDVESGAVDLVNAGHDAPWRFDTAGLIMRLDGNRGPPLCVMDDFTYLASSVQLAPGESLLLFTDGITEAMNASDEPYGSERIATVLNRALTHPSSPAEVVAALRQDVSSFVGLAESSDDLTLLVLQWIGPGTSLSQPDELPCPPRLPQ